MHCAKRERNATVEPFEEEGLLDISIEEVSRCFKTQNLDPLLQTADNSWSIGKGRPRLVSEQPTAVKTSGTSYIYKSPRSDKLVSSHCEFKYGRGPFPHYCIPPFEFRNYTASCREVVSVVTLFLR